MMCGCFRGTALPRQLGGSGPAIRFSKNSVSAFFPGSPPQNRHRGGSGEMSPLTLRETPDTSDASQPNPVFFSFMAPNERSTSSLLKDVEIVGSIVFKGELTFDG